MEFKKALLQFYTLDLHKKYKSLPFSTFCSLIQKENIKLIIKKLLQSIHLSIKPELVLTLYLICGYSKFILNNKQIDLEIKNISEKIITILHYNNNNKIDILLLKKLLLEFSKKFIIWKKNDKQEQIQYLIKSYYELEYIKLNSKEEIYKQQIIPIQNKLKNNIKKLGGNNALEELKNYKNKVLQVNKNLIKRIGINLKRAFWDKLKEDLNKTPPNMSMIPEILRDINIALKTLVPKNEKYRKDLDEKIDYEFLKQLIENNAFSFQHIFSLSHYIIDCIKELGMAEDDKDIEKLKDKINNIKNKPQEFSLAEYLPNIFKEIMDRIEKIQQRIIEISNLSNSTN